MSEVQSTDNPTLEKLIREVDYVKMELFIIICLKITEIIVRYERAKTFLHTMLK